jgi:biopolymer transport protein ExbD
MIEFSRRPRHARDPDLTPLVDIVFKLVLFFMLTSTFVATQSIELNLPGSNAAAPPVSSNEAMRIQIVASGHVMIDGIGVTREEMEDIISKKVQQMPDVKVAIFSTPGVSVQQLVSVMDMVYARGARSVQVDRLEYPSPDGAPAAAPVTVTPAEPS